MTINADTYPAKNGPTHEALQRWARAVLCDHATPALDARLLMMEAAEIDHATLIMRGDDPLHEEATIRDFQSLVARRQRGEPVSQIIGQREFRGYEFEVTADVLTPRPETERLIELAEAIFEDRQPPKTILDLGTGSGCLLVTLLMVFEGAYGVGVDICGKALSVAARNVSRHGLTERAGLHLGDFADPGLFYRGVDLIVSNPPYIGESERASLPRDVIDFEPEKALFGGGDGLGAYRRLFPACADHAPASCPIVFEIGAAQGNVLMGMARNHFPHRQLRCENDLSGRNRAIVII